MFLITDYSNVAYSGNVIDWGVNLAGKINADEYASGSTEEEKKKEIERQSGIFWAPLSEAWIQRQDIKVESIAAAHIKLNGGHVKYKKGPKIPEPGFGSVDFISYYEQ